MIKTEVAADDNQKSATKVGKAESETGTARTDSSDWIFALVAVFVGLVVLASYLLIANSNSSPQIMPARNIGNLPALPLITSNGLDSGTAGTASSLNPSSYNLQNNLPSGQGSPKANSLQSTGNSLSTGQSINTAQPY